MRMALDRVRWSLTTVVLLLTVGGCANEGPEIVPVSGMLTFEGREQPEVCRLTFLPQDSSGSVRPSGGEMASDGTYQPVAFRGVHGLYPGTYSVRLSYFDLKPGGNRDVEADWTEYTHEPTEPLVVESGTSSATYDITVPAQ